MVTPAEKVQAVSLFLTLIFCVLALFAHIWIGWKSWRALRLMKDTEELKELALDIATLGVRAYLRGDSRHKYEFALKLQKFERLTQTVQTTHLGIVKK